MSNPDPSQRLDDSTDRLLATASGLDAAALREPSLLPGWRRSHVLAHVALNAEGFTRALRSLPGPEPAAVYDSNERRDADIEELGATDRDVVLGRLERACTAFAEAHAGLPDDASAREVPRVPGGPTFPVADLLVTRRREVEIHHADLGAGYQPADWPDDFVVELLDAVTMDHAGAGPFVARATDLDRRWQVGGEDGPEVSGTAAALGWWLTGRGEGAGLTSTGEVLPTLGPWRRTPAR